MFRAIADSVGSDFQVSSQGQRHAVTVPLAVSDDETRWVGVEVRLWGGHWHGAKVHEFKFAIIHFDPASGRTVEIFDRYLAAGYLQAVRHLVLPTVCAIAETLIEQVRPRVIYRATYITRPPEKSLLKHRMITDTIIAAGYDVVLEGTDGHHRRFWIMQAVGDA